MDFGHPFLSYSVVHVATLDLCRGLRLADCGLNLLFDRGARYAIIGILEAIQALFMSPTAIPIDANNSSLFIKPGPNACRFFL